LQYQIILKKRIMKGRYITTSLMLAVLAGGKKGTTVLVDETTATTKDHMLIWSKTVSTAKLAMQKMAVPDELKMA
jgi:hypothetical protein